MTTLQHLLNVDAALDLVRNTPRRMINLDSFSNTTGLRAFFGGRHVTEQQIASHAWGVTACLGGLVACDPYFKALGVERDRHTGAPRMTQGYGLAMYAALSKELFGSADLFNSVSFYSDDTVPQRQHKDILIARLMDQRSKLLKRMERETEAMKKAVPVFKRIFTEQGWASIPA